MTVPWFFFFILYLELAVVSTEILNAYFTLFIQALQAF